MYKENLFKLIRKEEVIIWAGSGFSLYAGFPSGQSLGNILVENLSETEKSKINTNLSLPDLAEEFYRLKGSNRNTLIRILVEVFKNQPPRATNHHDCLSNIPHFKTIITTNYDTLIEDAFKNKGQVISSKHIPYLEKGKTQIFKVHGDLSEPDSIIVTKSDYNNFFKTNTESDVYWTVIKERLSTNSVLFLGYNLEDPNISIVFERITDVLGANRKEAFFVAPNLPEHKVNDLIRKGIHYINTTAEILIVEIFQNLKDNILTDIDNGKISADTFRDFLSNIDLTSELKTEKNGFKIKSLKGNSADVKGDLNFFVKNEPNLISELNAFIEGKRFGKIELPEDVLRDVNFWFGGLRLPDFGDAVKLELNSVPQIDTFVDIRFKDGFELTNLPIKLYISKLAVEVQLELKTATFVVNSTKEAWPSKEVKFNYTHADICSNTKEEIETFTFLNKLASGVKFTVYSKQGVEFPSPFAEIKPFKETTGTLLDYFKRLKKIENYYKLRFSNFPITSITDSAIRKSKLLEAIIDRRKMEYTWDDHVFMEFSEYSENSVRQMDQELKSGSPLIVQHKNMEVVELHGHKVKAGYKVVEFLEPYVCDVDEAIRAKANSITIRSKSNKILVSYDKGLEQEGSKD
jgi:hypothetical protein